MRHLVFHTSSATWTVTQIISKGSSCSAVANKPSNICGLTLGHPCRCVPVLLVWIFLEPAISGRRSGCFCRSVRVCRTFPVVCLGWTCSFRGRRRVEWTFVLGDSIHNALGADKIPSHLNQLKAFYIWTSLAHTSLGYSVKCVSEGLDVFGSCLELLVVRSLSNFPNLRREE